MIVCLCDEICDACSGRIVAFLVLKVDRGRTDNQIAVDRRRNENAFTEIRRLRELYQSLPPNKLALAEGLIIQAARLRVRLDKLWAELTEKGETEWFTQSEKTEPYERERPASRTFTATDKSYQSIIKQLNDMLPADSKTSDELELDLSDV